MAGRQLGDAYITISPDTRLFRTMTDAQVRKELAGFNPKVRIGADTKGAQVAITSFQTRVAALSKQLSGLRADAQTKDAESKIASVQARVLTLAKQMRGLTMTADAKKLDAQIAGEVAKLKGLQAQMSNLQADADTKAAAAKIAALEKQAFHLQDDLNKGKLKASVDITDAEAKLKSIDAQLRVLGGNAKAVKLAADSKVILTQIEVVKASLAGLQAQAKDIRLGANLDPAKVLASESALLGLEHIVENLGKKDVPVAGTAMGAFFSSMNRGSTAAAYGWKILTGHITLMGGLFNKLLPAMFTSVAVWHLLIDAAIEVVAVWAPAIIAVTAFGVAGADAGKAIYNRMVAVHTVMDATGQAVPPLTNHFNQLAAAVKPQVYQLFGDALLVMNKRSGAFNTVATGTGRVLDQLAARFVFAVTSGSGVNKFMEHAVEDVAKLGDSIGNLGGIFGAVFRAVPGYAEILLSVGDAITKVIESFTQFAEPVIAAGLLLHGFFIYGGLAVTVSLALVAGVVKLIGAFGKFNEAVTLVGLNSLKAFGLSLLNGAKNAIGYGSTLVDLARKESVAGAASLALKDAQNLLTKIPTTFWAVAAAAALITLVHAIVSSRDAAQQFNATLQQTIQDAPLANVATVIQQAQAVTAARLASTTRELNKAIKENTVVNAGRAGALNSNGTAVQNLDNASRHYAEGLVQLNDQQKLVTGRFAGLSKEYGNNTAALGALNAAGITTAQITDTNKDHWAQALIQVHATTAAYAAMGTQSGVLGNDLDVLGRTVTDQYTATQKLNQAWSSFISDVTSTQGTFDTVAQGFETLNTHSQDIKLSLGKLKTGFKDAHDSIDALTPAGIALNQAFADQVGNLDKLFASWRTAGLAGNLFTAGVKNGIAPLVKYAKGSQEATAQLVALAQEAGYQGPVSLQALTKWLGNTHGATQKLKDITDQATIQEALLTGAMRDQGNYIANKLLGDINQAILHYNGVEKAARDYGNAVARSGAQSDAAHAARQRLITDIIKSGQAAGDSKGQIAAMITKVLGIPPKAALQIVMNGLGQFSIKQIQSGLTNPGSGKSATALLNPGRAAGGFIDMGSGPTADDVPIMASRGEYVVKASSVAKYGKGTMDAINAGMYADGGVIGGYASGGLIRTGNRDVLSGQYVVSKRAQFGQAMEDAEVSAMKAALKSAEATFTATQVPNVGSGVARWLGVVLQALALNNEPSSLAKQVLYQIQTESGGNPNAINLSDINAQRGDPSRGLLQTIGSTFRAYHVPGTSWNIYDPLANVSAAINYARHVYGPSLMRGGSGLGSGHGYAAGGLIRKLAAGGLIGMASGGRIPVGSYLSQLRKAQGNEYQDYAGLRKAYQGDLKHAVKGSWTSGHRAGITSELGTLAKRQSAEEAAYDNILHHGTSKANLAKFSTRIRDVRTTSRDKDLVHSHPGWSSGLQYWLGVLTHLSDPSVVPVYGGTQQKLQFPAWLAKARADQAHEVYDYRGLQAAFKTGLSHARKGTWLYQNRRAIGERLYAVAIKQNAEAAAWNDLNKHATGSVSDLSGLAGRISKLGGTARAEASSLQPALLGHTPGGHPGWVKALQAQLKLLTSLAAAPPYNPPWAPGNLGPSHSAPGGVLRFDTGRGVLAPGMNLAWNGTGRNEPLSRTGAGAPQAVTLEIAPGGGSEFEQFMFEMMRRFVRVRGGGSAQAAFGRGT